VKAFAQHAIRSRYDRASFQRGERYHREGLLQDLQTHTTPISLGFGGQLPDLFSAWGLGDGYLISFREFG